MESAYTLLGGFGVGVLASTAVWYLLTRIGPRLSVAPKAAYDEATNQLHIKVINRGKRQVTGIRANLRLVEKSGDGDELRMVTLQNIRLFRDEIFGLSGRQSFGAAWELYPSWTFRLARAESIEDSENAEKILAKLQEEGGGERRLVFTLVGRHALTGTERITRTTFGPAEVKKGDYKTGDTFEIVPLPSAT